MKIKKVLITGPTGAVGMALIEECISRNIKVYAVCRPNSAHRRFIPSHPLITVVECGVEYYASLTGLGSDFDCFFHFAWDGTYGESRLNLSRQAKNIDYTLDAVKLAKDLGCSVFIGAGSQSEFGPVEGILHPDLPCNPDNGYGMAKLCAGQMSRLLCKEYGIRHAWCRILSLYGPYDKEYTMVMSGLLKLLNGERPSYTKGEQVWDYIYSKDAARAFLAVAEKGKAGAIYCFGTGETRKLKDFIYAIRDAIDPALPVGIGELDYYPNQVMHLKADIANLTADTGFVPVYSFEKGIRETIDWVKKEKK